MEQFWQKFTSFAFHRSDDHSAELGRESAPIVLLPETIEYLQELLAVRPLCNLVLYQTALTHRSVVHTATVPFQPESNQRLEFLGDSVLGLIISDYLFKNFPSSAEGELSSTRAKIVNSKSLAVFARSIKLGWHLLLGESVDHYNIRESESALADAFESLIGAIYLDRGMNQAYHFVLRYIIEHPDFNSIVASEHNYKSRLIEYTQSHHLPPPLYTVITETGAEHEKEFTVEVRCSDQLLGIGTARRKKDAEQLAAREAMEKIDEQRGAENNA